MFCRACLAGDVKLYYLENSFSEIYEKLANTKSAIGKSVCYICYALLHRCHRFLEMARYSENTLQLLHKRGIQTSIENIGQNPLRFNLSQSSIHIADNTENVTAKLEPIENVEIKLEPVCEDVPNEECIKDEPIESPDDSTDSHMSTDAEDSATLQIETSPVDIEKFYTCIPCGEQCEVKKTRLPHTKTHDRVAYACHECDKILHSKKSITRHVYSHIGYKPFSCDKCHKKFTNSNILGIHMETHNEFKPYKCNICDKKFSLKAYLTKHLKGHALSYPEKTAHCSICNRNFRKSYLSTHMKIHQGTEICYCDHCNKKFWYKSTLRKHMKTHIDQPRPFSCDLCDKSFTDKWILTKHKTTHTNEKPFECEVCKKTFSRKPNLNVHMRMHTGEKPYGCSKCDKAFSLKSVLVKHERTHTGERPFSCEKCHMRFTQSCMLTKHIKKHCKMSHVNK